MHWSDRKHRNCEQQKLIRTSKNGEMRVPRSRSKRKMSVLVRSNLKCARRAWGKLPASLSNSLVELTEMHALSIAAGHLQLLGKRWYITHSGLLHVGYCNHCSGIRAELQGRLSDPGTNRWVFRATVYKTPRSKGFIGYGDADPSNVSPLVHGAEMRVAETRAVNRALRKAYGIGLCSVDELGAVFTATAAVSAGSRSAGGIVSSNGNGNGQPRLRDQLCLAIRRFKLDPNLVKSYAADFCGTDSLSQASRESVQAFINHLNKAAEENCDALLCKLNSFAPRVEAQS